MDEASKVRAPNEDSITASTIPHTDETLPNALPLDITAFEALARGEEHIDDPGRSNTDPDAPRSKSDLPWFTDRTKSQENMNLEPVTEESASLVSPSNEEWASPAPRHSTDQCLSLRYPTDLDFDVVLGSVRPGEIKFQGTLYLKSRIPFLGWKRQSARIVEYLSNNWVLMLDRTDDDGNILPRPHMLIELLGSSIRLGSTKTNKYGELRYVFYLRTLKHRYKLASSCDSSRHSWVRNMVSTSQVTISEP